jgi:hypothetical protein
LLDLCGYRGGGVGIDGANHTVVEAGAGGGAVEEHWLGIIHLDRVAWRLGFQMLVATFCESRNKQEWETYVVEHFVHGVEAGEEAGFVGPGHFVGDAWISVFCAYDAVVRGVEAEFDSLGW